MESYLILESVEVYTGVWNAGKDSAGEVVFNTSHSGYEEIATDPSYFSQIVVLTAPMQGNYGADKKVWESRQLWIDGFVCVQIQKSHRDSQWIQRLDSAGIPLVSELDTRALVMRLRDGGTPWGALIRGEDSVTGKKIDLATAKVKAEKLISEKQNLEKDWVYLTSRKETEDITTGNLGPRIAVLDFGAKENILRELKTLTSKLRIFPSRSTAESIMTWKPDGLMLTNGPGDPADVQKSCETVRALLGQVPIFGICMGHQILSLALGGQTYKLKFGHRGANHPIEDKLLNKVYISSQNHGYAVKEQSLPTHVKVTQINLNDRTVAGIYSEKMKCLGIQYHPESHPGPHDAKELFHFFIDRMVGQV